MAACDCQRCGDFSTQRENATGLAIEFFIQKINIKETLLDDPKYDLLFSVDTLDGWVQDGMSFRDAYLKMKKNIAEGTYKPNRTVPHTHLGSRGQLALDAIAQKMTNVLW